VRELRDVIAKNICDLRTEAKMTQLALADVLNYSDKAISKWERGESVPDIFMLKRIADYFGVSVDYLLESDHTESIENKIANYKMSARNRFVISFLATMLVWFIATFVFVSMLIFSPDLPLRPWLMFIYAIPVSATVALVFNSIWGRRKINYLIISVLIWSFLLSVFMTLIIIFSMNIWPVFLLGIPGQAIVIIWSGLTSKARINKYTK
jgi:transcriptional regulator with XRE-family HTH domain